MQGYVHSINSLSAVDGKGIRSVIFMQGCNMTCPYCHNIDAKAFSKQSPIGVNELYEKIKRYYPYIKNGGVTFSGGEPLLQAEFLYDVACLLKNDGINIALDTAGCLLDKSVKKLLTKIDTIILDIKCVEEDDYIKTYGISLNKVIEFLQYANGQGKEIWIRHVVVEKFNDDEENILKLKSIISRYNNITNAELLPFKKLCVYKWENMGIEFPLAEYDETSSKRIEQLSKLLKD